MMIYAFTMKVRDFLLPAVLLLLVAWVESAFAIGDDALRAGVQNQTDVEWMPDGYRGLCPDIFRSLEKHDPGLKVRWNVPAMPERRLLSELAAGEIDIACGIIRSPERDRDFQIPDVVLYEKTLIAVVRDGDPLDLNSLADLKTLSRGDVVLVNSGGQMSGRLRQVGIVNVDDGGRNSAANLQKLILGRGRVFLYDDPAVDWETRHPKYAGSLHAIPAALDVDRYYMFLSHRVSREMSKRIGAALARMRDDGTLRAIVERWATRIEVGRSDTRRAVGYRG
ncbi:MAG TPA: transporter substrate-binding domain-containing protein [Burkholderiaceae bacterium]